MRSLALLAVVVGCSSPSGDDVLGPYTGEVHRFVVDRIDVPRDGAQTTAFAADLDGDGVADNQLGALTAVLAAANDLSVDAQDMIASGALASWLELQADDLIDDGTVAARFYGADGDAATVAGGRLKGGTFASNRVATSKVPGAAVIRLPLFTNADPIAIALDVLELVLVPDGAGGFDGVIRGGIEEDKARAAAHLGLVQMFETEPHRHLVYARIIDTNRDGSLTRGELDDSVIGLLVASDVTIGGTPMLSIAFGVHLTPCASGRCATATPVNTCRDRVRDGDETGIDCGGSCQPCWSGGPCTQDADCQSNACDVTNCRAHTCSDGARDGYESDVDCGGECGATCIAGQACAADDDCASGTCDQAVGSVGTCT